MGGAPTQPPPSPSCMTLTRSLPPLRPMEHLRRSVGFAVSPPPSPPLHTPPLPFPPATLAALTPPDRRPIPSSPRDPHTTHHGVLYFSHGAGPPPKGVLKNGPPDETHGLSLAVKCGVRPGPRLCVHRCRKRWSKWSSGVRIVDQMRSFSGSVSIKLRLFTLKKSVHTRPKGIIVVLQAPH